MKKIVIIAALSAMMIAGGCGDKEAVPANANAVEATLPTLPPLETEQVETEQVETEEPTAAPTEAAEKKSAENMSFEEILENTVFIGDSITSGFGGYQKVNMENVLATLNVAPSSVRDYTFVYEGEEYAALTILDFMQPMNVVVSMGLNDINTYSPERFSELYMEYVEDAMKVCEDSEFYIFSVTPVSPECENITNETIDSTNAVLKETVENHPSDRLHYVDCNSVLKDESGYMNEDYSAGDGVHLCSSAYDLLLETLEKTMSAE